MTLHRVIRTGFVVIGVTFMLSVPVGADSITYVGNGYVVSYDPSYVVFDPYNLPHWRWVHGPPETGQAGTQDGYLDPLLWVAPEGKDNGPNLPWHRIPSALDPGGATSGSGSGGPSTGGGHGGFGGGSLGPFPGAPRVVTTTLTALGKSVILTTRTELDRRTIRRTKWRLSQSPNLHPTLARDRPRPRRPQTQTAPEIGRPAGHVVGRRPKHCPSPLRETVRLSIHNLRDREIEPWCVQSRELVERWQSLRPGPSSSAAAVASVVAACAGTSAGCFSQTDCSCV